MQMLLVTSWRRRVTHSVPRYCHKDAWGSRPWEVKSPVGQIKQVMLITRAVTEWTQNAEHRTRKSPTRQDTNWCRLFPFLSKNGDFLCRVRNKQSFILLFLSENTYCLFCLLSFFLLFPPPPFRNMTASSLTTSTPPQTFFFRKVSSRRKGIREKESFTAFFFHLLVDHGKKCEKKPTHKSMELPFNFFLLKDLILQADFREGGV